jgi:hypothetical protein
VTSATSAAVIHSVHRLFNGEEAASERVEARVSTGLERLTPRQVEKLIAHCLPASVL